MKSLQQITDNDAVILKENDIRYIVIPVWELDKYLDDGTMQIHIDSDLIAETFNRILFNLECEYPVTILKNPNKSLVD